MKDYRTEANELADVAIALGMRSDFKEQLSQIVKDVITIAVINAQNAHNDKIMSRLRVNCVETKNEIHEFIDSDVQS